MQPTLAFEPGESPTKPLNDAPTLIRIQRLAALALERLQVCPDDDALALACVEIQAIESLAAEALK